MYNVVVVGADDSPSALEAFNRAVEFAKMSGGTLHIVTAYKPKPPGPADVPDEFRYTMARPSTQTYCCAGWPTWPPARAWPASSTPPRGTRPTPSSASPTAREPTSSWWGTRG